MVMDIEFIRIPIPTEGKVNCCLCDQIIDDEDGSYFVRVRDAAYVCKKCRANNPDKEEPL